EHRDDERRKRINSSFVAVWRNGGRGSCRHVFRNQCAHLLVMIICFFLHEATALWDVSYASATREVTPIEQHVHSFLEMMPLMGFVLIAILNWEQFLALFGL